MASIYDVLVRLVGDGRSLRDDLDKDKAALDELLDSLHNKDLTIDANIADAEAKLDDFKAQMDDLANRTADIHLDDEEAQAALDDLKLRLADLRDRAVDINVDDETAVAQLMALQGELTTLRDQYTDLLIHLDTTDADAALAALDATLDETKASAEEPVAVDLDTVEADARLDDFKAHLMDLRSLYDVTLLMDDEDALAKIDLLRARLDALTAEGFALTLDDTDAETKMARVSAQLHALGAETQELRLQLNDFAAQETLDALTARLTAFDADEEIATKPLFFDTTAAQAQLDAFRANLLDTHDALTLLLNDAPASDELAAFDAELEAVTRDGLTIRVDDADAEEKMDAIILKLNELRALATDLMVRVRVVGEPEAALAMDEFLAKEDEVRLASSAPIDAPVGTAGAGAGAGMAVMGGVLAGLAPAVLPVATAGLMGLVSMLGAAVAGMAALAVVALPAIEAVTSGTGKLDAEERAVKHSLDQFKASYESFAAAFQPTVLTLMNDALKMAMTVFTQLGPVIHGAASALETLFTRADHALGSPFWRQFFQFLGGAAHESLLLFGETLGNLAKTFAGLMEGFQPFTSMMEHGIERMTADWARWASTLRTNTEFQQFLAYVEQAGPAVMHTIGALVSLIMQLTQRLGPLSLVVVRVIGDLAHLVQGLLKSNTFLGFVVDTTLHAITGLLELADAIIKVITWLATAHPRIMDVAEALGILKLAQLALNFAMDANPIGLVIAALALLGLAAYEVIKHWTVLERFFTTLWDDIRHIFDTGIQDVLTQLHDFESVVGTAVHFVEGLFGGAQVSVSQHVAHMVQSAGQATTAASTAATAQHSAHVTVHVHAASGDAKAVAAAVLPHITRTLTQVARAGGVSR